MYATCFEAAKLARGGFLIVALVVLFSFFGIAFAELHF